MLAISKIGNIIQRSGVALSTAPTAEALGSSKTEERSLGSGMGFVLWNIEPPTLEEKVGMKDSTEF